MAKLVVLSEGMTGRTHELKADKTTIGRVEDNTFQIAEPSVSSHHCEILLRGADVVVKDLNSTNGTFLDGRRIDAVMHFAAFIEAGESMKDPGRFYQNNFTNSLALMETAVRAGVKRFVLSSTAAVYQSSDERIT